MDTNVIINADCLEVVKSLDDNSIDLLVTSPPYNASLGKGKMKRPGYDSYEDNMDYTQYLDWITTIFAAYYPKLKDGGRVAINISDNGNGAEPTHAFFTQRLISLGYGYITTIVWNKKNVGVGTSWGSFNSPSSPSFPTPFEYVLVFYKGTRKLQYKGETDLTKEEFIAWSRALWEIAPESRMLKKYNHPAVFPEELVRRIIKMFTWKDALVVDVFGGSGTTAKVAKELGRNYIIMDISENYCETARKRIEDLDNERFSEAA